MADEIIGGIGITITGDYSGLIADFQEAQNLAKQAGDQIAASFEGAAGATGTLEERVQALIDTGSTLAQALDRIKQEDDALAAAAAQAAQARICLSMVHLRRPPSWPSA